MKIINSVVEELMKVINEKEGRITLFSAPLYFPPWRPAFTAGYRILHAHFHACASSSDGGRQKNVNENIIIMDKDVKGVVAMS